MTEPRNREELLERFGSQGEVYEDGSEELRISEDDGTFFLEHFGVRLCPEFIEGQGSTRRDFNRECNQFLRNMGYSIRYSEVGIV